MRIELVGVEPLLAQLRAEPERFKRAVRYAVNDTADDVLALVQSNIKARFDRPTRWTMNAFMVKYARIADAVVASEVTERPSVGRRHYLKVQEAGGQRPLKGIERGVTVRLSQMGIKAVIPTSEAKLDAHGNWSPGERNQAISAIGGFREVGYNANRTRRSQSQNENKRANFFVIKERGNLKSGIYRKKPNDSKPVMVAYFAKRDPQYRPLLGFFEGARQLYDERFRFHLYRALEKV